MIVKPFEQEPNGDFINKLSNHLFDFVMPKLKPSEWMVLCYIIRKTTGWHKDSDKASLADIKNGTGIKSVTTVSEAVSKLEEHGYILVERGPNKRKKNIYTLNTCFELDVTMPKNDTVAPISNEGSRETTEAPIPENDTVNAPTTPENDTVDTQTISKNDNYKIIDSKQQFKKTDSAPAPKKQKPARIPKPPKPPPEPNPAFDVYYRITEYPKIKNHWRNKMREDVGDTPASLELWAKVVEAWIGKGWFEGNVKGMLECFNRGEIPGYDRRNHYEPNPTKNGQNGVAHQAGQDVHGSDESGRAQRIGAAFAAKARTDRPPP